ncbi:hypothetical protein H8E07_01485 [bacterium]|nr:hypothetical protein [bacterium]
MTKNALVPLGYGRVFRHRRSGEIVVDTDTLRRRGFGDDVEDFGDYDDDFKGDDDDFEGDDDDFEGDDDDFEGDDDDFEGDEDDDFGARRRRRRRRRPGRRGPRSRTRGRGRGRGRRKAPSRRSRPKPKRSAAVKWGKTVVSGSDTLAGAGQASIQIRLQHKFKAEDVTFEGSAAGSLVNTIFFGDKLVFQSAAGVPVTVFASTGFLRKLVAGHELLAGLDINVTGTLAGAGTLQATVVGLKPVMAC